MFVVEADSASEIWATAWSEIIANGSPRTHSRGDYAELLHAVISLRDPRQRWVTSRKPPINPAFALAEVIWILRGREDSAFLVPWNSKLPQFAGEGKSFYGAYGKRLRSRFGFDQLARAAQALRASPDQRQVVLQIWDAQSDFPTESGNSRARDIPCNVSSLLKVVDGRLEWLQVMRSNDLVRGLPYNLVQWTTIHEVLAGWLSLEVGSYVHISDSLHVYDSDRPHFGVDASKTPWSSTDLRLPEDESELVFRVLESATEAIGRCQIADNVLALTEVDVPVGYKDWLYVLASERTRRLGEVGLAMDMLEMIEDEALHYISRRWHMAKKGYAE